MKTLAPLQLTELLFSELRVDIDSERSLTPTNPFLCLPARLSRPMSKLKRETHPQIKTIFEKTNKSWTSRRKNGHQLT